MRRYDALVCDYDGTIALGGIVPRTVSEALQRVRDSGRKLILLTGRELPDLLRVCPDILLFDRVVAENGAVLYQPDIRKITPLVEPPPASFLQALMRRGIEPLSQGQVIIATLQPREKEVLDVIREQGLEMTLAFNKGAVMVLPSGVNKETGLKAVLKEMGLSLENCIGVGDGENDQIFLKACGYSVALANAIPGLKEQADMVSPFENGKGVQDLIKKLLASLLP